MNIKFYLLVHDRPDRLEQRLQYYLSHCSKDKLHVVINSQDSKLETMLCDACIDYDIGHTVTVSDGTPSTGKNAMLKTFLSHKNEYAVCIDGDDIVTPWGIEFYSTLSEDKKPPDLLTLYKQISVKWFDPNKLTVDTMFEDLPEEWEPRYVMDAGPEGRNIHHVPYGYMLHYLKMTITGQDEEDYVRWATARHKYHHFMNTYSDAYEYMLRMVFWSKKAARLANYDKNLVIGEDTNQFLRLKRKAFDGEIRMFRKKDGHENRPTYFGVDGDPSITRTPEDKLNMYGWDWVIPLNESIEKLKQKDQMPPRGAQLPDWTKNA